MDELLTKEEIAQRRVRGSKALRNPPGIYFNRAPEMPEIKCANAGKDKYADCCDDIARTGFSLCNGCTDRLKGIEDAA